MQPIGQPTDGMSVAQSVARMSAQADAHDPRANVSSHDRVANRLLGVLAKEIPHPTHAIAAHDMIGADVLLQDREACDVPADDDRRVRLVLANQLAHASHFEQVGHDRADTDHVVLIRFDFFEKSFFRREIEQRARCI